MAGAAQVIRIRRTRTVRGRKHVEVVHPVLLPSHDRRPARTGRLLGPRASGHREPPPLDPRRGLRRGPPPAAHRQRTTGHGRPAKPRHQPHPPGPRPRGLHRRHHQGHGPTPPTSHRPDHPPTPINRLCRDPGLTSEKEYYEMFPKVRDRNPCGVAAHESRRSWRRDRQADGQRDCRVPVRARHRHGRWMEAGQGESYSVGGDAGAGRRNRPRRRLGRPDGRPADPIAPNTLQHARKSLESFNL